MQTEKVFLPPPQVISNEVLSRHNVYGVTFNGISSKGKPLYNAIDQKWVPATPTDPGVDTWKDLWNMGKFPDIVNEYLDT